MHKTKNESMGVLKLKLDITPENIESLKALFLKPENKISNIVSADTMLFNGKSVGEPVENLPTVATLRTKYGYLQDGDIVISQSDKHAYIGIVTRFTESTVFLKNVIYVYVNESTGSIGINCHATYSVLKEEITGLTKNQ